VVSTQSCLIIENTWKEYRRLKPQTNGLSLEVNNFIIIEANDSEVDEIPQNSEETRMIKETRGHE
jgi:hypothetical protein